MSFSESKTSSRGPLIAVIKIQLSEDNTDRIFLHLNDDDQQLASNFIQKHGLNKALESHIYQRIKLSRMAIERQNGDSQDSTYGESDPNQVQHNFQRSKKKTCQFLTPQQQRALTQTEQAESPMKKLDDITRENYRQGKYERYDQRKELSRQILQKPSYRISSSNNMELGLLKPEDRQVSLKNDYISYTSEDSSQKNQQDFCSENEMSSNHKTGIATLNSQQKNSFHSFQRPTKKHFCDDQLQSLKLKYGRSDEKNILKPQEKQNNGRIQTEEQSEDSQQPGLFEKQISRQDSPQRNDSKKKSEYYGNSSIGHLDRKNYSKSRFDKEQLRKVEQYENNQFLCFQQQINSRAKYKKKLQPVEKIDHLAANGQDFQRDRQRQFRGKQQHQSRRSFAKYFNKQFLHPQESQYAQNKELKPVEKSRHAVSKTDQDQYISFQNPTQIQNNFVQQSMENSYEQYKKQKILRNQQYAQTKQDDKLKTNINETLKSQNCLQIDAKDNRPSIGLIRSNSKPSSAFRKETAQENSEQKTQNIFNKTLIQSSKASQSQVRQPKYYFNDEQLFGQIGDIGKMQENLPTQNIKNQNLNFSQFNFQKIQESNRPSRVKILNKSDIQSLKQSTFLSKSMSKAEISRINRQVTSRLYNENDVKKKYLNALKERAQLQKQEQQLEEIELTHKPTINPISRAIAEGRRKDNKTLEEHLFEQGKIIDFKKQDMINRQAQKQLENCSFRPQINEISSRLATSKSRSRITTLSQAKCFKHSQSQQSFKPEINRISNELVKSKGNFMERQSKYQQQKNCKLFKRLQEERLKEKADIVSGRKLYQPQLTQRSKKMTEKNTKRSCNDVYTYLYQLSKEQKKSLKENPKPQINQQSEKMVMQMQEKRMNWLFSELDSDEDGVISPTSICIDHIPTQLLEIIAPVLYEMEDLNTELNLQDFKNSVKILHKNLDPYEKSILYSYKYNPKPIRT